MTIKQLTQQQLICTVCRKLNVLWASRQCRKYTHNPATIMWMWEHSNKCNSSTTIRQTQTNTLFLRPEIITDTNSNPAQLPSKDGESVILFSICEQLSQRMTTFSYTVYRQSWFTKWYQNIIWQTLMRKFRCSKGIINTIQLFAPNLT